MMFNWLYRFVRRHTKPIPEQTAELWKRRLSFTYAILAWNAFGIVCYYIYTGRKSYAEYLGIKTDDDKLTPAQQWSKTLGIKDATVYRIQGFKVQKYEVHNDFEKDKGVKTSEPSDVVGGDSNDNNNEAAT